MDLKTYALYLRQPMANLINAVLVLQMTIEKHFKIVHVLLAGSKCSSICTKMCI